MQQTLLFFILILWTHIAFGAEDFYAKCLKPGSLTDKEVEAITLTPINYTCHKLCKRECHAFSRKIKKNKRDHNEGIELNEDIIDLFRNSFILAPCCK